MTAIVEAAESGNQVELLKAMQTRVAKAVDDPSTPARDLAALTRRLLEITREIEALTASEAEDEIGEASRTPDAAFDPATL